MFTDIKFKEATNAATHTREDREEREEENDATYGIYNYISEEK